MSIFFWNFQVKSFQSDLALTSAKFFSANYLVWRHLCFRRKQRQGNPWSPVDPLWRNHHDWWSHCIHLFRPIPQEWKDKTQFSEVESFPNQWGAVDSILISPDNLILSLVQHSSIKFISLRTKVLLLEIKHIFNGAIKSVEFSPDSELVAVAGDRWVNKINRQRGWAPIFLNFC